MNPSPKSVRTLALMLLMVWLCGTKVQAETKPEGSQPFDAVATASRTLQAEWADVFYNQPREHQGDRYQSLLERIRALKARHPERAEPLIVEAIILCTARAAALGLDTIEGLEQARTLLETALRLDPKALEGAAYVTLGNLYRRLPGWPILYGDRTIARSYLMNGVKQLPDGIDTNYFLGDFLLEEGDVKSALPYLEKAAAAPIRQSLRVSDEHVHQEAVTRLGEARSGQSTHSDVFDLFTPSFR